jgi:hypothetical protein
MAIAFVNATNLNDNSGTTTSLTAAYTIGGGADRLLIVAVGGDTANGNTATPSVTYNSVAMHLAVKNVGTGSTIRVGYMFYLLEAELPAAGAHNVVVDFGASTQYILIKAADYTGVVSYDGQTNTGVNAGATNTLATTLTPVADNCWVINVCVNASGFFNGITNGTLRIAGGFGFPAILDSNAPITPPSLFTMTIDAGAPSWISNSLASFSPTSGGGGGGGGTGGGLLLFGGSVGWTPALRALPLLGAAAWKAGDAIRRNATLGRRRLLSGKW